MSDYSKDERNNRQLILWGEDGQAAVDNARIVVLGSDCVVSEFLKNIVLHGFGNVTIIDDAVIDQNDIRSNFLVDVEDVGKSRAESVAKLLKELNEYIKVEARNQSPLDLSFLEEDPKPEFVISSGNLKPSFLIKLSELCRQKHILQGHIQSAGFFGAFYLDADLHTVFNISKQNLDKFEELRTINPFEELREFFTSFKLELPPEPKDKNNLPLPEPPEIKRNRYAPPPAIIYQAYSNLLQKGLDVKAAKNIRNQIYESYVNLKAVEHGLFTTTQWASMYNINYNLNSTKLANVKNTFEISSKYPNNDEPFWQLVRSTKRFYEKHGVFPHYGGCPDLDTSTENYLELKRIYQQKFEDDCKEMHEDLIKNDKDVDDNLLKRFVRNVTEIGAFEYKPISEYIKYIPPNDILYQDNSKGVITVQCLFVAIRNFYEKYDRQPNNTKEDQDILIAEIKQIGGNKAGDEELIAKYVKQFSISRGCCIPSVAATIGAIFAEEVTKIVIHQATPIKGAFIFNGITSTTEEFY